MMDEEAARMLADLGIHRRDAVSAPEEGRRAQIDPRQQAAVVAEFKARRAQITAGSGVSDEKAARLRAWNTESTFERDEVTAQLENRFDGQGHRAGLSHLRQYDDHSEALDARVGEERRQYVLERDSKGINHTRSNGGPVGGQRCQHVPERVSKGVNHTRSNGDREFLNLLGSNAGSPRGTSGRTHFSGSGREEQSRNPIHARAPSPRRFGTVRFAPGGRRTGQPAFGPSAASTPAARAPANVRAAPAPRAPTKQTESLTPADKPTSNGTRVTPASLAPTTNSALPVSTTTNASASSTSFLEPTLRTQAAHHVPAGNPIARPNHIADAIAAMKAVAAKNAKVQNIGLTVPTSSQGATKTAIQPTPAPIPAPDAPKAQRTSYPSPSPSAEAQAATPMQSMPNGFATALSASIAANVKETPKVAPSAKAPKPPLARTASNGVVKSAPDHVHDQKCYNRALWFAANPGQECDEYHKKYPDRFQKYFGKARDHLIKEALNLVYKDDARDISIHLDAHKDRTWMLEMAKKAKSLVESCTEAEIEAEYVTFPRVKAFIPGAKVLFAPRVPALSRASSTSTATETNNSDSSVARSTATQLPTSKGTLATAIHDIDGHFLEIFQLPIEAPVYANLSITSRTRGYDPRQLIRNVEALAKTMIDKSQGLEGVKLADDGVWEEL